VLAVVAQELDVVDPVEPFGVVDHDCVGGLRIEHVAWRKLQEGFEVRLDQRHVGRDFLDGEDRARLFLVGRVADFRGAATHEDDGFTASLLKAAQVHDLHQRSHMERLRRGVEADIAGGHA
jgi:hypothetical protein